MPRKFDFLSPGIEIREVDQSILPANVDADGPVIIGRFRKGPGMKPTKVRSLDYFVSVYGNPVPGGSSEKGDVWRDGAQLSAPTYAAYAAQSWLASRTSPVNLVRLLGDQHPQATGNGLAGWQTTNATASADLAQNGGAYGLFICNSGSGPDFSRVVFTNPVNDDEDKIIINDGVLTRTFEFDNNGALSNAIFVSVTMTGDKALDAANFAAAVEAEVAKGFLNVLVSYDAGEDTVRIATLESVNGSLTTTSHEVGLPEATLTAKATAPLEGALAAIFYVDNGSLTLDGNHAKYTPSSTASAEHLIISDGPSIGFTMNIHGTDGLTKETISFNFDRNSSDYIRSKFNTNPQAVNSGVTDNDDLKTYWLGESFERHLKSKVTTEAAGKAFGVLLPLQIGTDNTKTGNWSYHRIGSQEAKSGWLFTYNQGKFNKYQPENMTKLFRFESLHAGEEIQKSILIAIEELKLATNEAIYPYGTFTVKIMDTMGGTLEKYSGCNLDPNSPNFVARRIGDMYMEWSDTDRRYRSYGNFSNVSDYVRIKMYDEKQNYKSNALPAGFYGPGRPKGFGAIAGDTAIKSLDLKSDFTASFSRGNYSVPFGSIGEAIDLGDHVDAVRFVWPSMTLRQFGSDGFSANPYKVHFGIHPKATKDSTLHDVDYVDYTRMLPSEHVSQLHDVSGDTFEYSFVFSLDDIKITENTNTVEYASGSHKSNTSWSAQNGFASLLDKDVKQFVLPLFGGFDGLNIKEEEPFNYDDIQASTSETTNYLVYSLNKALDSVSDAEVVPANLISAPGIKNNHITDKVIRVAESRKDMLAVIDLVGDYTPAYESRDTQKKRLGDVTDTISNLKNRAINSSYACAYYPAVQIQDNLNNGERIWVPSSVAGLGAMAQSEARSELWFAPAGFNRGGLGALGGRSGPRVLQARQRLDVSERDKLYEVNINPIATFPNEGVVIFGQKTLQQTQSALDRINVRRLMIYLKAEIGKVARNILFDNNVRSTWSRFTAQAEPILSDVKSKFGLTEYRLILDSSTTTADLIDRNIMYAKVFLKPARAIEFIAIDFVITRTGAEFA